MLNGGTQRPVLARFQSEEMKLLNILFPRVGIEPTTRYTYSHTLVQLCHDWVLKTTNKTNKRI